MHVSAHLCEKKQKKDKAETTNSASLQRWTEAEWDGWEKWTRVEELGVESDTSLNIAFCIMLTFNIFIIKKVQI